MKNRWITIFTCLALTCSASIGTCFGQSLQSVKFQAFTTKNGLSGSEVNGFSEDTNGFLWVSTHDGICRFDGLEFKSYRLPVVDTSKISSNNLVIQVQCIQQEVWCLNRYGYFFRLDRSLDAFDYMHLSIDISLNKKLNPKLFDFVPDAKRNCFWVKHTKGIFKYDLSTGVKENVVDFKEAQRGELLMDTRGRLWYTTRNGERCYDPETGEHTVFFDKSDISAHCQSGSKIWCMSGFDALHSIDINTGQTSIVTTNARYFFKILIPDCAEDIIQAPVITGDSILLIATCGNGLVSVNINTGKFSTHIRTETHETEGFVHDWINQLFISRDNCLWLATQKGMVKIDVRQQSFFTRKIPEFKKLQVFRIRQVQSNPKNLDEKWVATSYGLYLVNIRNNTIVKKFLQPNDDADNSKEWAKISCMQLDKAGNLWVGTVAGLVKIDTFYRLKKFEPVSVENKVISDFIPLDEKSFWVRNNSEAGLYWPERGQYFPIRFPPLKDGSPAQVYQLNLGLDNSVLICCKDALWRVKQSDFDEACGCFPHPEKIEGIILPSELIENDTAIWGMTPSGLVEFHKQKRTNRIFGEKEGLSNLRVRSMLESRSGQFWMNSDNGLFVFHPEYGRFTKYTEEDGLADNYIPGILSRDNESFHAGFSYALTSFIPTAKLLKTNIKPCFTGVFALDQRLPVDFSAAEPPAITVDYTQNILRFEFTCPDFYQSEKITFHYQLEGFEPARRFAGFSRSAVYTNLDGGNYRFLVWATNADGFLCEQPAVFLLRVVPPFYRTWWFYTLCFASVGLLFYAIFRYREIQRLRQEQLRLRIARDLHDEVGSTLSSISILSASALRGVEKDLDNARFGNIGDKARAALDSISDIVWSVNPENDSMDKALARMSTYASEMLENVGAELRFEVGEGVESLTLPMEKRKDFYLIFKEAIHNCAKYAQAKHVDVALWKEGNTLIMSVKDDGVGFEVEQTVSGDFKKLSNLGGNGLRNMRSRAVALGADFQIESATGIGTVVLIKIPMK